MQQNSKIRILVRRTCISVFWNEMQKPASGILFHLRRWLTNRRGHAFVCLSSSTESFFFFFLMKVKKGKGDSRILKLTGPEVMGK